MEWILLFIWYTHGGYNLNTTTGFKDKAECVAYGEFLTATTDVRTDIGARVESKVYKCTTRAGKSE